MQHHSVVKQNRNTMKVQIIYDGLATLHERYSFKGSLNTAIVLNQVNGEASKRIVYVIQR